MYRIGTGFDIHRIVKGRKMIVGGIEISSEEGFLAHSDGDIFSVAVLSDAALWSSWIWRYRTAFSR
ncbi:MAG: 2-C-methyl-D-erythritol 2,4-cyclodiphosphate synthase [Persephonella sp.]|nr:2-C-methyl-D-erythritol 2,4-cyclodiphosphate synthase [Persephonella sp.]